MGRVTAFIYGLVSYAIFLGVFLYALGFVGNFLVPTTLDSAARMPLLPALAINLGVLGLFALQHSVMARPTFKKWWTRYVPEPVERSTYVLASNLAMILLFWAWQPLGGVIWDVQSPAARVALYAAFGFGWGLVLVSTFLINHFDLFGLRQVWLYLRGKEYTPLQFVTPGPYKYVRHPMYVGWLFAFWATPTMGAAHLLFAIATTGYILIAIQLEERNLVDDLGDYAHYRSQVPMIVPTFNKKYASGALVSPEPAEANA